MATKKTDEELAKEKFYSKMIEDFKKEGEEKITEDIELKVNLMKVRSKLGGEGKVTEDYVLAKFNDAQKIFIEENFKNAHLAKGILEKYSTGKVYEWDEEKMEWKKDRNNNFKKVPIDEKDSEKLKKMSENLFEFFMMRPHLIAILNRNRKENFMIKLLGKGEEEKEETVGQMGTESFLDKMRKKINGEEESFEEE